MKENDVLPTADSHVGGGGDHNKTDGAGGGKEETDDAWLEWYSKFDEQHPSSRSAWYDQATEDYRLGRPRYPDHLIDRVCRMANLKTTTTTTTTSTSTDNINIDNDDMSPSTPACSRILEIGCGPGTATLSFCQRGISMLAMDPSPSNCAGAKDECQAYCLTNQLEVVTSTFEDWNIPSDDNARSSLFDAVLCANSFHWIPASIRLPKICQILQQTRHGGALILLWAFPPTPSADLCEYLRQTVFEPCNVQHLGELTFNNPTSAKSALVTLYKFHDLVHDSGYFENPAVDLHVEEETKSMYSIRRYLALLNSLSPYIELDVQVRATVLQALRDQLIEKLGGPEKEFECTHWYGSQVSFLKKDL
jgi:SAM-dependent methyltransferase